ncbi:MAG TPA: c-type cytochrome, partial [Ginsengibacter sp.]|nr:c-type cytochrome [Ginsengibacter sp.]
VMMGKNLMMSLDCKGCHKVDEKSIGPAFTMVSQRYQKDPNAMTYLAQKVIKGGSGAWGEVAMAAHPNLKESDARQIISWVLSLAAQNKKIKSLPASGNINATLNKPVKDNGILYISADYTDNGGNNIKPLMGSNSVALHNSKISFDEVQQMQDFSKAVFKGTTYMVLPQNTGWFSIDSIDLSGISRAVITMGWQKPPVSGYTFELHVDAPRGNKIGEFTFAGLSEAESSKPGKATPQAATLSATLNAVNDGKLHNIYVVSKAKDQKVTTNAALSSIQFFIK